VHRTITGPVRHPRTLPRADIVKLDTEGAEAEILADLDVAATSLILLEFHHRDDLQRIEAQLHGEFEFVRHERLPWQPWLNGSEYRQDLAGDDYGRLFAVRRDGNRLARVAR